MSRRPRAFTLLELLISIGVIALLIGLIVVSMKGVRAASARTESTNALRNLMRGYLTYSSDHKQYLLPGFVDEPTLELLRISVTLPDETRLFDPDDPANNAQWCSGDLCDASSYVWRLMPYLDNNWRLLMVDYGNDAIEAILDEKERIDRDFGHGTTADGVVGIGVTPAYGLNSIFLGGDTTHADNATITRNPFTPANPDDVIAARRTAEVLNPSRITVFAASEQPDESTWDPDPALHPTTGLPELDFGYCELRAPYLSLDNNGAWGNPQWWFDEDGEIEVATGSAWMAGGSFPVGRNGPDDVPVGHLDGATEIVRIYELGLDRTVEEGPQADAIGARNEVMSRWSPFATGVR